MAASLAIALVCAAFDQEHAAWTTLLQRYGHASAVDYAACGTPIEFLDYEWSLNGG
jgi:spore germination protein YaaH